MQPPPTRAYIRPVMKVVIQRVERAKVTVEGEVIGQIGRGLLLLVGLGKGDDEAKLRWAADKIVNLRIFEDEQGKMNRSLREVGGKLLVVSQFTLYGDLRRGRRPSFDGAAPPEEAERLFDRFVELLRESGLVVETGRFGAYMAVELVNDGPVTLILER